MDSSFVPSIILFLGLMACSAFFSGIEIALSSLNPVDIQRVREKGGYRLKLINIWAEHPGRVLTSILIGNNLANTAAATMGSVISLGVAEKLQMNHATALAIATGIVTFAILIIGEITPKTFAKQNHMKTVEVFAAPMMWVIPLFKIPSIILTKIASIIIFLLGGQMNANLGSITEDDIRDMIRVSELKGVIDEQERKIIHSVIDFGETTVAKVMTPRVDVAAISYEATIAELLALMNRTKFSRIPIFEDDLDTIIGVAYIKNALKFWQRNLLNVPVVECQMMPFYVPTTKHIGELLYEFQQSNNQMAIVFDEYGQTVGLVTVEDILEELVGDIRDEHETRNMRIEQKGTRLFIVSGPLEIEDLNEALGLNISSADFKTVSGWVNWLFGKIPQKNERLRSRENIEICALEVEPTKVIKVSLTFPTDEPGKCYTHYIAQRKLNATSRQVRQKITPD